MDGTDLTSSGTVAIARHKMVTLGTIGFSFFSITAKSSAEKKNISYVRNHAVLGKNFGFTRELVAGGRRFKMKAFLFSAVVRCRESLQNNLPMDCISECGL